MTNLLQAGLSNALVATLFALLVVIAAGRIKHPAWRHALWVLVLLKLVTPPLFALPFLPSVLDETETIPDGDEVIVETPIEDGPTIVTAERVTF